MKSLFAVVLSSLLCIGCGDSAQVMPDRLENSVRVTHAQDGSLIGGGRWFRATDTITWYDIQIPLVINNTGKERNLSARLELGFYSKGIFVPGNGTIIYAGDSITSLPPFILKANKSEDRTFFISSQGMTRRNNDWRLPYGYQLRVYDKSNNDSLIVEGIFEGSIPDNRFRGIIYTTEFGPDSLGLLDSPDDNDWNMTMPKGAGIEPCFPNPTNGLTPSIILRFDVSQRYDSIYYSVNQTPSFVLLTESVGKLEVGRYEVNMELTGTVRGTYRLYYHLFRDGVEYVSHGDVMIEN